MSQDTYPVNFNNPVELNRYVYVANDPVNAMDPSGHLLIEYVVKNAVLGAEIGVLGTFACGGSFLQNATIGALLGAGFTIGFALPWVAETLLVGGTVYSLYGAGSSIYDLIKNGYSNCSAFNAGTSLLFAGVGIWGISISSFPSARYSQIAQEENIALGLRFRPWGAELLERLGFTPKPGTVHATDIIWKGGMGLRLAKAAPGRPWWEIRSFVSDSDAGFFWRDGNLVPERGPDGQLYWRFLNNKYGTNFQHGAHVDGMRNPEIIDATRARAQSPDSTVYLPNGEVMKGISLIEALRLLGAPSDLIQFLENHP